MITKVTGFIIHVTSYKETSLVIQLLTKEYGLIGVMAKGVKSIKSRLRAMTLPFTYGYFYIYYKEGKLSILNDVDIINPFKNIHNDIEKLTYLNYLAELSLQVVKEIEEKVIFDLLTMAVLKIEEGLDPQSISHILEMKYLPMLGVGLCLDACVLCERKTNIITISMDKGGLLCSSCYHNEPLIPVKVIKLLRLYQMIDIRSIKKLNVSDEEKKTIELFLDNYYSKYTGIYLNSKEFLNKLKNI